jgi:hypothetical protein
MTGIGSQSFRYYQQSISKSRDTILGFALDLFPECFTRKVRRTGYLECPGSWNYAFIDNHVVDTSQAIANCISDLSDGVGVRALNQKRY